MDVVRGFKLVSRDTMLRNASATDFQIAMDLNIDPLRLFRYYKRIGIHRKREITMSL